MFTKIRFYSHHLMMTYLQSKISITMNWWSFEEQVRKNFQSKYRTPQPKPHLLPLWYCQKDSITTQITMNYLRRRKSFHTVLRRSQTTANDWYIVLGSCSLGWYFKLPEISAENKSECLGRASVGVTGLPKLIYNFPRSFCEVSPVRYNF